MTSAAYYRNEAEQARAAAENSEDPETVLRWLRIANEYRGLAHTVAAAEARLSPAMRMPRNAIRRKRH